MVGYKNMYYIAPTYMPALKPASAFLDWYRRFEFKGAKYYRYGLYHDDLLYEYPHIKEAIRRLPTALKEERDFRMIRAYQLDLVQELLPREKWHTLEEDLTKGRYLQPYIKDVLAEIKEMDLWEAEH